MPLTGKEMANWQDNMGGKKSAKMEVTIILVIQILST